MLIRVALTIIITIVFSANTWAQKQKDADMKGMDMTGMDMNMHHNMKKPKTAIKKSVKPSLKNTIKGKQTTSKFNTDSSSDKMTEMNMNNNGAASDTITGNNMSDMNSMNMHENAQDDTMKMQTGNKNSMDSMNVQNTKDTSVQQQMSNMDMNDDHVMEMNHDDMQMQGMENMSHSFSLHLPMGRNGSGTGWLPDASPMYGYMYHSAKWMYMLHGNLFLRYTNQDFSGKGNRGGEKFDAPNWIMLMGQRQVGNNGLFHFSAMLSLDPITERTGYPLLFQSGETYNGKPLIDRQHPHDFFSELAVSYSQALSPEADVFFYLGYPGEPALGPVAFMHRPSALDNPDAPITHHWVDATHITFGVATLGLRYGNFKLEGSSFTGKEPDENRYDFDKPLFNSWSGRVSYNPTKNWALQVSHGFIKSPEILHAGENVNRTTASAIYSLPLANDGTFNATAIWGVNKSKAHKGENAYVIEASWKQHKAGLFSKYEYVQKSIEELVLDEDIYGHDAVFPINAITAGLNYDFLNLRATRLALGSQFTLYHADKNLNTLYGKNPMAFEVYLRLYPGMMKMKM